MQSVLNKGQNNHYYNIFSERCSYQLAKINDKNVFDGIIMLEFGEIKVVKENIYGAKKTINTINIWDVNVDKINTKLIETKTNSKYLIV